MNVLQHQLQSGSVETKASFFVQHCFFCMGIDQMSELLRQKKKSSVRSLFLPSVPQRDILYRQFLQNFCLLWDGWCENQAFQGCGVF